ncbi:hypothetical protein Leryth_022310 [Lithospermum erythrorhizon]|nr:hypothetical protein Leryth_022310 [Lithospermum erythrorhizon]
MSGGLRRNGEASLGICGFEIVKKEGMRWGKRGGGKRRVGGGLVGCLDKGFLLENRPSFFSTPLCSVAGKHKFLQSFLLWSRRSLMLVRQDLNGLQVWLFCYIKKCETVALAVAEINARFADEAIPDIAIFHLSVALLLHETVLVLKMS